MYGQVKVDLHAQFHGYFENFRRGWRRRKLGQMLLEVRLCEVKVQPQELFPLGQVLGRCSRVEWMDVQLVHLYHLDES